ncbi:GLE1-like protein-domain-containing protein [Scenedesmus sp. NREL 46B-D3]|nr:GLE1-like protein-domain-containing protein [Scenedesmus sp. NREL 46B-D3]
MGDVVKQLVFSPIANSPDPFFSSSYRNDAVATSFPARRLDESLADSSWGAAAAAGHSNSSRPFTFRAPSEDEDDDDVELWDADQPMPAGNALHLHNNSNSLQSQQQQQSSASTSYMQTSATFPQHSSSGCFSAGGTNTAAYGGAAANGISAGISSSSMRHPVQAVLEARTKQLQADALLAADRQQRRLRQQIQGVEQRLTEQLQEVQQQLAHKRAHAAAADEESRRKRTAERSRRLAEVQKQQAALEQAQASALQELKRAQDEAARRQQAEAEAARKQQQQQEEEKQRREAEAAAAAAAKAAEEAKARDEASNKQQQQQQQQQQSAAAAAGPSAGVSPAVGRDPHLKSTAAAVEYEQLLQRRLAEAEAAAAEITSKPELKQQRRALEKQITMAVSQISGTQQQVLAKSQQLVGLLRGCATPQHQALACTTLASRVVSQCEGQVQKIGSFAYPLAYVCVSVGAAVPAFMELLLAKLQAVCPLLVPKYTMYSADTPKEEWFEACGYKEIEDPKTGAQRRENADEFVSRMTAMVLLYGAIVQTATPGNPAGLEHGWAWLARCLNALPPTRPSATALMSFLAHAGYRMAAVYGRQFQKVRPC